MINIVDRAAVSISSQNREFVDQLCQKDILGFDSLETKDIFLFVCALGLNNPTEFKNKVSYVRTSYFKDIDDRAILIATKLGTAKTIDEIDKYCNIEFSYGEAEKCANTGFDILREKFDQAKGDEELLAAQMLLYLDTIYQKHLK